MSNRIQRTFISKLAIFCCIAYVFKYLLLDQIWKISKTKDFPTLSWPILVQGSCNSCSPSYERGPSRSPVRGLPSFTMTTVWDTEEENNIWQWGWQRYSTRLKSFKRRGRRRRERFLHYFLKIQKYVFLKKQNYLFWKCRLKKFNQGEERRDRANAWLHLQPHRSVTFILSSSKLHNHPSQCSWHPATIKLF